MDVRSALINLLSECLVETCRELVEDFEYLDFRTCGEDLLARFCDRVLLGPWNESVNTNSGPVKPSLRLKIGIKRVAQKLWADGAMRVRTGISYS
jgi:hypothetical protein